ncbi:hypothetical protein AOLI_G00041640 [Acnodon oligacanthus]
MQLPIVQIQASVSALGRRQEPSAPTGLCRRSPAVRVSRPAAGPLDTKGPLGAAGGASARRSGVKRPPLAAFRPKAGCFKGQRR